MGLCVLSVIITMPKRIVRRIREEAKRLGVSVEEYLLELTTQDLDPRDKAVEYIETARELLQQAYRELEEGNIRQAAEKLWGATALAIKAYAWWREGRRLASHYELWEYKDKVVEELGEWVRDVWNAGQSMHTCFYEGWCTDKDVEATIKYVERLVKEIKAKIHR